MVIPPLAGGDTTKTRCKGTAGTANTACTASTAGKAGTSGTAGTAGSGNVGPTGTLVGLRALVGSYQVHTGTSRSYAVYMTTVA